MIPEQAIKKAVYEGDYDIFGHAWEEMMSMNFNHASCVRGRHEMGEDCSRTYESIALDPSFWQSLGKALGWRKKVDQFALGNKIRQLRTARGLKQEELGKELGYSAMGISHFEKGVRTLSIANVEKLARFFGEEPAAFLPFQDEAITNAHRFYDLILTGGDIEKFWDELLTDKN